MRTQQEINCLNPFPTLVSSEETSHFGAVPTAPVPRREPASRGGVWVFPRSPQASLGQSRRSARALAVAVRVV